MTRWNKLTDGGVGYCRRLRSAGIVEIFPDIGGHKPHVRLLYPDGTDSGFLDYDLVSSAGSPPIEYDGLAMVLWTHNGQTGESPPMESSHTVWSISKLSVCWTEIDGFKTGLHWVLCKDLWAGKSYWLGYNFEREVIVDDSSSPHRVILENIGPETGFNNLQESSDLFYIHS